MAEESLSKSMQLVEWLARQVGGVRLGGDLRTRVTRAPCSVEKSQRRGAHCGGILTGQISGDLAH
jgi:hypothetical protein